MPVGIKWKRVCIYLFNVAPGLLCRRKRHQNIKDIRSCCFTATGTTVYLLSCPRTALQGLPPTLVSKSAPPQVCCYQPPRLFPLMEEKHAVPWLRLLQMETVLHLLLPHSILCQAPIPSHSECELCPVTDHHIFQSHLPFSYLHSLTQRTR